jgi:hypothetical protein
MLHFPTAQGGGRSTNKDWGDANRREAKRSNRRKGVTDNTFDCLPQRPANLLNNPNYAAKDIFNDVDSSAKKAGYIFARVV